jgi:hypothetical protein
MGTSLQLQPITTAHNQWMSKTCSIPYWITSVFSSSVTNDERKILFDWIIELPYECQMIHLSWTELTSRWTEYRSPLRTVSLLFCFIRCIGKMLTEPLSSNCHSRHNSFSLKATSKGGEILYDQDLAGRKILHVSQVTMNYVYLKQSLMKALVNMMQ